MHPVARFLSRSMAILVGASILLMAGCAREVPVASLEGILDSLQGLPFEAQKDLVLSYPCDDADHLPPETAALLANARAVHNEVHDCQRLVVGGEDQREFGPLVGIFPILNGPVHTSDSSRVVATVFNWKEESYEDLGIGPGWSCLVMKGDSAAEIRPASDRCAEASFAGFDPVPLTVVRTVDDDVPMTARWGWDETNDTHYIGLSCSESDAWCEIGAPGVQPQEWIEGTVPGWYDQQHLAVEVDSDLSPGPWATIFPSPGLRDADEQSFEGNGGAEVAFVLLEDFPGSNAYQTRFGFRPTPNATGPRDGNKIRLEMGNDNTGRAHISTPGSPLTVKQVPMTLVPGLQHGAKGSVRWRWSADDESWWVSCPDGCCSPEENGGAS